MSKTELLAEAKALGLKPVTRNSVAELEAMIAGAKPTKPKASRAAKAGTDANVDVAYLVTGIESGDFAKALAEAELSPGGLARQLGVESAVVAKLASGQRTPRGNATADSIAGKVAAWYAEASRAAS